MRLGWYFRVLSFDVVVGVVGAATLLGHLWGAKPAPVVLGLLAGATWLVYTLDHLLDARRISGQAHNPRHGFFQRNRVWLWRVWLLVLLLLAGVTLPVVRTDLRLLVLGGWAVGLVVAHLLALELLKGVGHVWLPKEFGVAFIYSYGACLPALVRWQPGMGSYGAIEAVHSPLFWVPFVQLVLVAWMNLLVYSYFEFQSDRHDGQLGSYAGRSPEALRVGILVLLVAVLALGVALSWRYPATRRYSYVVWMMGIALVQALVVTFDQSAHRHERYRIWAESAFFAPLLLWLW